MQLYVCQSIKLSSNYRRQCLKAKFWTCWANTEFRFGIRVLDFMQVTSFISSNRISFSSKNKNLRRNISTSSFRSCCWCCNVADLWYCKHYKVSCSFPKPLRTRPRPFAINTNVQQVKFLFPLNLFLTKLMKNLKASSKIVENKDFPEK